MNLVENYEDLHNLIVSASEPTTMDNGDPLLDRTIWLDTSGDPWLWKRYDLAGTSFETIGAAGSGITDHGELDGLPDDDHPQYLLGTDGGKGTVNVVLSAGAALTLDLAAGNDHDVTLDADCTLTLAGATAGMACYLTALFRQDATGGRTVTFPASFEWVGGSEPVLQTAGNAWDFVAAVTYDGGATWFAQHGGTGGGGPSADDEYIWKPLLDDDGSIVTDGAGDPVMGFAPA